MAPKPRLVYSKVGNKKYAYIKINVKVDGKYVPKTLADIGRIGNGKGEIGVARAKREFDKFMLKYNGASGSDMPLKDLRNEFTQHYKTQIGSSIQEKTYLIYLEKSLLLAPLFYMSIEKIKYQDVEFLKGRLKDRGLKNRTVNMILVELNKMFKYAIRCGYVDHAPIVDKLKETPNAIEALTIDEVNKILSIPVQDNIFDRSKAKASIQQMTYFKIMVWTGMRPHEMNELRWEQVNFDDGYIQILSDNDKKPARIIPITDHLRELLLSIRKNTGRVSPYSKTTNVYRAMVKLGKKAGLRLNRYMLRKTFSSILANNGMPVFDLIKLTGHKKVETLSKHYVKMQADTLKKSSEMYAPDYVVSN